MTRLTTLATTAVSSIFLVVTLAACPGDSESGGTCADYTNAYLGYFERCQDLGPSLASTRPRFTEVCNRALAAPGAANMAAFLSACTQKIAAAACGSTPECEPSAGTLENDAACAEGYQCKSGACSTIADTSCGKCVERAAIGAPCTSNGTCVEGAQCVFGSGDEGTCRPKKVVGAGESCSSGGEEVRACGEGLRCSYQEDGAVCQAPGAAGTTCSSSSDCIESLRCIEKKCATPVGDGGACTNEECAKGFGCETATKKCVRRTYAAAAGAECDNVRGCAEGLCRGIVYSLSNGTYSVKPGKCIAPLPDGAACSKEKDAPRCDLFASCLNGKCTVQDPALCK